VIESGKTEELETNMLTVGGNTSCSPLESKAKDRSSTGFQPFLGLFYICSIVAILALLYSMICLLMNNVQTFISYIHVRLTQLSRIWRCTSTVFLWELLKTPIRKCRPDTVTRNTEDTVIDSQQSTVVIDVVLAANAS